MRYWEILLKKQRERGKDGLTLPFLIGSQEYLPDVHVRQNIEELILDIVLNGSFETCIRYCMGTQTLIFEIRKPCNRVFYPMYSAKEQKKLSVAAFPYLRKDLGDSIEGLCKKLTERFQDVISDGHYSAEPDVTERNPNWKPFSQNDDVPFIKNSFKLL